MFDCSSDLRKCLFESFETYSYEEFRDLPSHELDIKNSRVHEDQLKGMFANDNLKFVVNKNDDGKITAVAGLDINPSDNTVNIDEIFSLEKGAGAELLKHILSDESVPMIWLTADWGGSSPETLYQYYRRPEFGLKEFIWKNERIHEEIHFFYKNNSLSEEEMQYYLDEEFCY